MKGRGGLGREAGVPSLTSPPPSLFFFSRSFLVRTAPHYLNACNRLEGKGKGENVAVTPWKQTLISIVLSFSTGQNISPRSLNIPQKYI